MVSYGFGKVGEGGTKELVGVGQENDQVGLILSVGKMVKSEWEIAS